MQQIIQSFKTGETILEEVPKPQIKSGHVLIRTTKTLVSLGTERMLVGFYPDHFMYGSEESYLSRKLFNTKFKIIKDESVILWHLKSDTARNKTKESLSGYFNKLYIAVALFPLFYAFVFSTYLLFKYPQYAKRDGILYVYLKSFPKKIYLTIKKAITNRLPVSMAAYKKIKILTVK